MMIDADLLYYQASPPIVHHHVHINRRIRGFLTFIYLIQAYRN